MILVVGATGILGGEICRRLCALNETVRALVRHTADSAKLNGLKKWNAELVYGDLRDRASLDAACKDVGAVISTATAMVSRQPGDSIEATDHNGQLELVEAAKAADVPHFIFVSCSGNIDNGADPCPLIVAKRSVEQRLLKSGMAYTILRPSICMEFWLNPTFGFDYPNTKATVYGKGHAKISYISLTDVAEFAVQSLDNPAARNAVIELGGPEALSPLEAIAIFEQVGGRRFEITNVPVEALQAQKAAARDSRQKSLATLMLAQAGGDVIEMRETLRPFPLRLTSAFDCAQRMLPMSKLHVQQGQIL